MTLLESCNFFQIHNLDKIDKKILKKKYHKMCLIYHPDKNKNHHEQFIKMKECYETLNSYIDSNQQSSYKEKTANIYETLASLISVENIKYAINLVDSYKIYVNNSPELITLNVTLKQIFDKCVYINNSHYIPLWHKFIHQFSVKQQKHIIYSINITDIPPNVHILKNNDIYLHISKKNIKKNAFNTIRICKSVEFNIYISTNENTQSYILLKNKGIPKTNIYDIFDSSQLSNIHLYLNE